MAYNALERDVLQHIQTDDDFYHQASLIFDFQKKNCQPFRKFLEGVNRPYFNPQTPAFLPIELFKSHDVFCGGEVAKTFLSSGTESNSRSKHHFSELETYRKHSILHFEKLFGPLSEFRILALLPSYLEQGDSSLVFMIEEFMKIADQEASGFFLHQNSDLNARLATDYHGKTMLIGVSYALLDFADQFGAIPDQTIVMETGGMKGRKKELTRAALHHQLKTKLGVPFIYSEYGMTELSSQAYLMEGNRFTPPSWMKCFITDLSDPLSVLPVGRRGCLAFIDLANQNSCAFIQTRDIGMLNADGTFTVEGRLDLSDLRGCNLLYT